MLNFCIVFGQYCHALIYLNPNFPTDLGVDSHDGVDPEGLVAVGLRSIDALPHEVQRQRGTQGLLVQRKTMASQPSVTTAEQLTMTGRERKK